MAGAHIVFSGLCFLAAIWHWVYWDLSRFCEERRGKPSLDLPKIWGIHFFLLGWGCDMNQETSIIQSRLVFGHSVVLVPPQWHGIERVTKTCP